MITGWVKNIISSVLPAAPNPVGQGVQAFEKKAKAKLVDVTEGVSVTDEVRRRSLELLSMIRRGGVQLDRLRLWINVRRKMRENLADFYDIPEIMDEVTEKIREVAEHDPFYKRLFR